MTQLQLKVNQDSFLTWAVRRGLTLLPADEANKEIVRLTIENMMLRAEIDALTMIAEGKV